VQFKKKKGIKTYGFVHVELFVAVGAVAVHFHHGAAHVWGAQNAVLSHDFVLEHRAENVPRPNGLAFPEVFRLEGPLLGGVQRLHAHAPRHVHVLFQRVRKRSGGGRRRRKEDEEVKEDREEDVGEYDRSYINSNSA